MYTNKILNFQESTTISNARTKKSLETYRMPLIYIYCVYIYIYILRVIGRGNDNLYKTSNFMLSLSLSLSLYIYIYIYIYIYWGVFKEVSKSPQVSWTLLNILADLNNAVVLMDSTRSPSTKSSTHCTNHLETARRTPITIGICITFKFHSFFFSIPSQGRGAYFQFYSVFSRDSKVHSSAGSLFSYCLLLGLVIWPR